MRTLVLTTLSTALLASLAWGQTPADSELPSRVFFLSHAETQQSMQEILNIVRSMSDTPGKLDVAKKAVTLQGNSTQFALAEWVISEMDRDAPSGTANTQSYRDPRGRVDVVRLFALKHVTTPLQMQELTNLVRSISDIQRVFPYNALHQLVVRSSAEQMAIAEWLIQQLDRPPDTPAPDAGSRDMPWGLHGTHTAKVFYLTHGQTPQQTQAVLNQIKNATRMERGYPFHTLRALALRGTPEQMTAAAALLKELDAR